MPTKTKKNPAKKQAKAQKAAKPKAKQAAKREAKPPRQKANGKLSALDAAARMAHCRGAPHEPETRTMTVRELVAELAKLPPDLPVYVASTPGDDQCPLEMVVPHLGREDDDYLLMCGAYYDEA
jgi:hypothetical protein